MIEAAAMKQYEYRTLHLHMPKNPLKSAPPRNLDELNALGAEGWHVVAGMRDPNALGQVLYLEREVTAEA